MDTDEPKPRAPQLSKTPSWVMLGFILGGLFVYTVQRQTQREPRPRTAATVPAAPNSISVAKPEPDRRPQPGELRQPLYAVEDVFETYKDHALWEFDTTQVAIFNPETNSCTDYVEVLRDGDKYYFRTLSRLTRPLIDRGLGPHAPIVFTEPESMREERRLQGTVAPRLDLETAPPKTTPLDRPRPQIQPPPAPAPKLPAEQTPP